MYNIFDLTNKVAIVTGASSGLGAQMSKAFAESGADVAILARRFEKLETLASKLEYTGRKILPIKCDITKESEVASAINLVINTFGKVDILVNNAGVASIGSVDLVDEFEWDRVIDTNLKDD